MDVGGRGCRWAFCNSLPESAGGAGGSRLLAEAVGGGRSWKQLQLDESGCS